MKKVLLIIIWIVLVAGLVFYLISHSEDLARMLRLSAENITLLLTLAVITLILNGMELRLLISAKDVNLGFKECFHLANVASSANYLPLRGGLVAKAFYLKKRHGLLYMNFADITIAGLLITFMTIFATGAVFVVLNYITTGKFFLVLFLTFSAVFLILLLLSAFLVLVHRKFKWEKLGLLGSGLRHILAEGMLLVKLILVNLASIIVMGLRFFVSFRALSYSASFLLSLLCALGKKVVVIIGIVPSGLGVSEAFAGAISELMKGGLEVGVFAASIDRIISIVVLIPASAVSLYCLKRIKRGNNA